MTTSVRNAPRRGVAGAWAAALVLGVAILLVWPVAEIGILDDWSTARTAQLLAETGHVHYNGWEAPMLGWMLYVVAPFVRLLGFSFTLLRVVIACIAAGVMFLLQRVYVLGGLPEEDATLGALTIAVSPIAMLTSTTFMSDMPGLLAVVACLYCCLRALQPKAALRWVVWAVVLNVVLGTARQNAWLGMCWLVPVTLWLLHTRGVAVRRGILVWAAGGVCVLAAVYWLRHQPQVLQEHLLIPNNLTLRVKLARSFSYAVKLGLDGALLSAPVCFAFVRPLSRQPRRLLVALVCGLVGGLLMIAASHNAPYLLGHPLARGAENLFIQFPSPMFGATTYPISLRLQQLLTLVSFCAFSLAVFGAAMRRRAGQDRDLIFLLAPLALFSTALGFPRAVVDQLAADRYLLFLLPFVIPLLLRRLGPERPSWLAYAVLTFTAVFTVLTFHNSFALYRAQVQATGMLERKGIPRTAIDGGMEYNFMTQIQAEGWVRNVTRRPAQGLCHGINLADTPAVQPRFGVAYPDAPCVPVPGYATVHYRTWLPPFDRSAVVVEEGPFVSDAEWEAIKRVAARPGR